MNDPFVQKVHSNEEADGIPKNAIQLNLFDDEGALSINGQHLPSAPWREESLPIPFACTWSRKPTAAGFL